MKIKKIVDQCKRRKMFYLFDGIDADTGETFAEQWIGNGEAFYPLEGVPRLDKESIYTVFDIPEKQQKKIGFRHEKHLPEQFDFSDTHGGEKYAARLEPWLVLDGTGTVIPYATSEGITFVAKALLDPLEDIQDDVELYERHTKSGQLYFAAKNGLLLVGLILPMDIVRAGLVEQLRTMAERCEHVLNMRAVDADESGAEDDIQE